MRFADRKLLDVKTQEIEANLVFTLIQGVRDVGLAGFQGQSHACQPGFGKLLYLLNRGFVRMQHDEIIRITNDGWLPSFSTRELGERRCDSFFQPMQGNVCQQR